jgi:hypothetical protein
LKAVSRCPTIIGRRPFGTLANFAGCFGFIICGDYADFEEDFAMSSG